MNKDFNFHEFTNKDFNFHEFMNKDFNFHEFTDEKRPIISDCKNDFFLTKYLRYLISTSFNYHWPREQWVTSLFFFVIFSTIFTGCHVSSHMELLEEMIDAIVSGTYGSPTYKVDNCAQKDTFCSSDTQLVYLIGQNFGGQNFRNFEFVPKILSAEKFCPPKILSAKMLSNKVIKVVTTYISDMSLASSERTTRLRMRLEWSAISAFKRWRTEFNSSA